MTEIKVVFIYKFPGEPPRNYEATLMGAEFGLGRCIDECTQFLVNNKANRLELFSFTMSLKPVEKESSDGD